MMTADETIEVPVLTRVEGEGGVTIRLKDQRIAEVQLRIYEPPRLFESLLVGRPLEETPDITARICGICPVAYQMSSVHALEAALGITITPSIRQLRRLLYCGEWIESHGLHVHLLHAPDFFNAASGIELAQRHPEPVQRGLRLKKHGNQLLEVVGGRAIHPINCAVGGFYRWPQVNALRQLIPAFEWGLQAAIEATEWVAAFPFPEFSAPYEFVALHHPGEYPFNEGELRSSAGWQAPVAEFPQRFEERQVPHSTALQAVRLPTEASYFLGPLARVNLNHDQLRPSAKRLAERYGIVGECRNPFRNIIARCIELVQVYDEALELLSTFTPAGPSRIAYEHRAGRGCAATEAPRGMLFHEYEVDAAGKIVSAQIVPPTSQNQRQIEVDLQHYLTKHLDGGASREQLAVDAERLVRTYDPCISCSTHFLRVVWETV